MKDLEEFIQVNAIMKAYLADAEYNAEKNEELLEDLDEANDVLKDVFKRPDRSEQQKKVMLRELEVKAAEAEMYGYP